MNAYQLIAHLSGLGVKLRIVDGKINVKAQPGVIDQEIKLLIGKNREQLVSILGQERASKRIDPVDKKPHYQLSSAQKRMFFLSEMNPESIAYNMPQVMDMNGDIDVTRLIHAFEKLISRHEILRTTFGFVDQQACQFVHQEVNPQIQVFKAEEAEIDQIVQDFIRPFILAEDSLIRLGIIEVSDLRWTLIVDMHHIVSDGVSLGILMQELMTLYNEESLEPLRIQYKDFAEWQQETTADKDREFWINKFVDYTETLELPIDYNRSSDQGMESDYLSQTLGQQELQHLNELCEESNTTLFSAMATISAIWLSRLNYEDTVVIGTPAAGRNHPDLEGLVGMFVNTLPLKFNVDQHQSFREFLKASSDDLVACFDHQNYPYENLVDELRLERDPHRNPLFDVMFSFQNLEQSDLALPEIQVRGRNTGVSFAKFDLTISAETRPDKMLLTFEFPKKLFRKETVARFSKFFLATAHQVINQPDASLLELDLLGEERQKLLNDFNATQVCLPQESNFIEEFNSTVSQYLHHTAIVCGEDNVTYQALIERAAKISLGLTNLGIGAGDVVSYISDNSSDMIVGLLGIMSSGAIFLPIDPAYPEDRIRFILKDSKSSLLLTNGFDASILDFHRTVADVSDFRDAIALSSIPVHTHEEVAYVIYTSGSTGKPKGVKVSHRSLLNMCQWHNRNFEIGANDKAAKYAGFGFDASVWEIFPYLLKGSEIHILKDDLRLDVRKINDYFEQQQITIGFLPTQVFEQFIKLENQSLRTLLTGGDNLKFLHKTRYEVVNNYGPTENTVVTTSEVLGDGAITIGKPIDNVRLYIVDTFNRLQPIGVPGELCIGGKALALGYLHNEEMTAEKFIQNPFEHGHRMYKTGDLAKWLPDGRVAFLGRIDSQVKIRGFRIELGEVEQTILEHPEISEVTVVLSEQYDEKNLVAYYVSNQEPVDLRSHLRKFLPDYMIPSVFVQLENLPLTPNGKIDKKALPKVASDQLQAHVAPSNETEEKLVDLWASVIKRPADLISVMDNFFHIGGHSLNATAVVNKIHEVFQVSLSLRDLFRNVDIQSLAGVIQEKKVTTYVPITPAPKSTDHVLSAAQRRMYILYEMDRDTVAYNVPQVIQVGPVAPVVLDRAFRKLIDRHEILRTTFHQLEGNIFQRVESGTDFALQEINGNSGALFETIQRQVRPFDLAKGPLIRATLIRISDSDQLLFIDLHHIITDGVSNDILTRDFRAFLNDETLPELKLHYKDFASWQQENYHKTIQQQQKEFWVAQFAEEPRSLELPYDHKRPERWNAEGSDFSFQFSPELSEKLLTLSRKSGFTPYTILLSVFGVVMSRLAAASEVVIGTPVSGRTHADLHEMVGMFVNTLPLVFNDGEGRTVLETLKHHHAYVLQCLENQSYQYEDLVDELKVRRDLSRNPLFDVMFAYQEESVAADTSELGNSEPIDGSLSVAKFDLTLNATRKDRQFHFVLNYAKSLFKEETIRRWVRYMEAVALQMVEEPNRAIDEINLVDQEEKEQLIAELSPSPITWKESGLLSSFESRSEVSPDQVSVVLEDQFLTYSALNRQANQLAHYLIKNGIEPKTRVGFRLDRSMDMIVAMLAILKCGGTFLPLDPVQPENRIKFLLEEAKVQQVLTDHWERDASLPSNVFLMESAKKEASTMADHNLKIHVGEETTAYILYTSGSTGKPKGVEISRRSLLNLALGQSTYFGITPDDHILQFSSIVFDASMEQIWMSLLTGAQLILIPKPYLTHQDRFNQYLNEKAVTHLHATPSYLEMIELTDQPFLKRVVAGGEVCRTSLAEKFVHKYEFYNEYGPTETTVTSLVKQVDPSDLNESVISLGLPVANTSVHILDQSMNLVPKGVIGELYIGGAGLSKGYVSNPEKTKESFVSNPFGDGKLYKTGDLAKRSSSGEVMFMGRIDHQVKIRGFRIELSEIENVIVIHPQVQRAVVQVISEQIVSYYQSDFPLDDLSDFVQEYLPAYMIPTHLVHMKEIPLTPTGKINIKGLPIPEKAVDKKIAPQNETELLLQDIWHQVLELPKEQIGVEDNFFSIGGHSLNAMRLCKLIKDYFQVDIMLVDVFQQQRLGKLSELIQAKIEKNQLATGNTVLDSGWSSVIRLNQVADATPIFWVHDGSGDVSAYLEVARHLDSLAAYGIISHTLSYLHPVNTSVEELARYYVSEIRHIQPTGPYHLAGWSFGGVIALQITEILESENEEVALLVMIDSVPVNSTENSGVDFSLTTEQQLLGEQAPDLLLPQVDSVRSLWADLATRLTVNPATVDHLKRTFTYPIANLDTLNGTELLTYYNTNRSLVRALACYEPQMQLAARALIYQASETDYDGRKWGEFFCSEVTVMTLEGDHFSMLKSETAQLIAEQIGLATQVTA